ncbi:MAG: hypothetical protein ACRBI6_12910 [Acidimicrobiales bacterium]
MPWCDTCDRYLAPNAMTAEGTCPTCDEEVDTQDLAVPPTTKAPWHFWVMVVALVAYLGWRVIEAAIYLIERL